MTEDDRIFLRMARLAYDCPQGTNTTGIRQLASFVIKTLTDAPTDPARHSEGYQSDRAAADAYVQSEEYQRIVAANPPQPGMERRPINRADGQVTGNLAQEQHSDCLDRGMEMHRPEPRSLGPVTHVATDALRSLIREEVARGLEEGRRQAEVRHEPWNAPQPRA